MSLLREFVADYLALPEVAFTRGGIRDFGSGQLAFLHGREAVFTERQLGEMIAAAARKAQEPLRVEVRADLRKVRT